LKILNQLADDIRSGASLLHLDIDKIAKVVNDYDLEGISTFSSRLLFISSNISGNTLLTIAAQIGNIQALVWFLTNIPRIEIDKKDINGATPLSGILSYSKVIFLSNIFSSISSAAKRGSCCPYTTRSFQICR
jgi:hypothetical protein